MEQVTKNPIVEEIHNEFDSAAVELLAEANKIIQGKDQFIINKVNLLTRMGFGQSEQVVDQMPTIKIQNQLEEELNVITQHNTFFQYILPKSKYLRKEQVEKICKKYNLIIGTTKKFKGFVPNANLKEIEKFYNSVKSTKYTHNIGIEIKDILFDDGLFMIKKINQRKERNKIKEYLRNNGGYLYLDLFVKGTRSHFNDDILDFLKNHCRLRLS